MTIRFQQSHSRSSTYWEYQVKEGRHTFIANRKGVMRRVVHLHRAIIKNKGITPRDANEFLISNYDPYSTVSDTSQALKQLVKLGVARQGSRNGKVIYLLTAKHEQLWKAALDSKIIKTR